MNNTDKYLRIIGLEMANYKNLRFKKLNFENIPDGHLRILGNVGAGKTNLVEIIKISTQDNPKISNKNVNPNFNEKAGHSIQFSDSIWLNFSKTPNGTFQYSLFRKDANGNRITALDEKGDKINASEYKKMLTTELTYGVDEFLSDSATTQFNFLKKIYLCFYQGMSNLNQLVNHH